MFTFRRFLECIFQCAVDIASAIHDLVATLVANAGFVTSTVDRDWNDELEMFGLITRPTLELEEAFTIVSNRPRLEARTVLAVDPVNAICAVRESRES